MFSPSMIKPILYLLALCAIIAACYYGHGAIKQSGYDQRVSEESEEYKKQLSSITRKFKDDLDAAKHEAEFFRKQAVILQQREPIVVTKIKEKIVYENINTCTRINGLSELWNARAGEFTF